MCDSKDSDLLLLDRWREGDARAGNALCRRHERAMTRYFEVKVTPSDVPDLVQRTWLAATGVFQQRGREVKSVRAYLFGIARHILLEYIGHRRQGSFDPMVDSLTSIDPTLSSQLFVKRRIEWLDLAISSLPIELHLLVEARRAGLRGPELAEMFVIPEGTVRSRMARALHLLQQMAAPITGVDLGLDPPHGVA